MDDDGISLSYELLKMLVNTVALAEKLDKWSTEEVDL